MMYYGQNMELRRRMGPTSKEGSRHLTSGDRLCGGAELLHQGLRWEVRNGRREIFWKDSWLDEVPLVEKVQN